MLLDHFGSLDDIRKATAEEIASIPGIPYSVGQAVKSHLA
ncbi:MAG: helix-hairpin-helix domain-containing protein [Chloroflexota bacterium]